MSLREYGVKSTTSASNNLLLQDVEDSVEIKFKDKLVSSKNGIENVISPDDIDTDNKDSILQEKISQLMEENRRLSAERMQSVNAVISMENYLIKVEAKLADETTHRFSLEQELAYYRSHRVTKQSVGEVVTELFDGLQTINAVEFMDNYIPKSEISK